MKLSLTLQIDTPRFGGASTPAPSTPTGFAAVPGIYEVAELSWDLNPATSTNIYVDGVLYDNVAAGTNTYSFTGTPPGAIYDFQISAVSTGSGLESSLTAVISCAVGTGFTGALDAFTSDLAVAWSTSTRLLSGYGGSLIRIRRSSDDAELDIGFATDGSRDDVTMAAFVGSDSAYVTTVYDQSGNGVSLIQATSSVQPRLVDTGSIESGGMRFYSTQRMNTASLAYTSFAGATAVQIVAKATIQTSPPNGRLFDFASTSEIASWLPYGTDVYWDAPSATARIHAALPGGTIGSGKTFSFERSGANQQVVINNSVLISSSGASGSLTATGPFCVASDALFNPLWLGWLDTMVLWKTTTNASGRRLALA